MHVAQKRLDGWPMGFPWVGLVWILSLQASQVYPIPHFILFWPSLAELSTFWSLKDDFFHLYPLNFKLFPRISLGASFEYHPQVLHKYTNTKVLHKSLNSSIAQILKFYSF